MNSSYVSSFVKLTARALGLSSIFFSVSRPEAGSMAMSAEVGTSLVEQGEAMARWS